MDMEKERERMRDRERERERGGEEDHDRNANSRARIRKLRRIRSSRRFPFDWYDFRTLTGYRALLNSYILNSYKTSVG